MPQTRLERSRIDRVLGHMGLGQLGDPGLFAALGFLVEGHDHLRQLINACEAPERVNMYNALKPNLRFEAKPLDVYIAELGQEAAARQMPTIEADGSLKPFKVGELRMRSREEAELETAQNAINEAVAKVHLEVACGHCTRAEIFPGVTRDEALLAARRAGWRYDAERETELCAKCLGRDGK